MIWITKGIKTDSQPIWGLSKDMSAQYKLIDSTGAKLLYYDNPDLIWLPWLTNPSEKQKAFLETMAVVLSMH